MSSSYRPSAPKQYLPTSSSLENDPSGIEKYRYQSRQVSPEEAKEIQDAIRYIRENGGDFSNYNSKLTDQDNAAYGILNTIGRDARGVSAELARGLRDFDERQTGRQGAYGNLVNRYLNDYGAGQYADQYQERKVLDQLYGNATGANGPTPGDLNRIVEAQQRANSFARSSAGAGTSGANPLQAARGISDAASRVFGDYERQQGADAADERLGLQRDVFNRMRGVSDRDYAASESLREAGNDEQRRLEALQSNASREYAQSIRDKVKQKQIEEQNRSDNNLNLFGAGMKALAGGAAGAAMSDKRSKQNIKPGATRIDVIFEKVKPKEFEYKDDPRHERRMGVMAQDLEKAGLDYMVKEGEDGYKRVLTDELATLLLSSQSRVFERLKHLEEAIAGESGGRK